MRLVAVFFVLAAVVLVPFLIWGERFEEMFTGDALQQWLAQWGLTWAWALALALLVADLFLPVPGTAVMSGLGYVYGTGFGGLIAAAGSFLGGALAYGLCRSFGTRMSLRLMGEKGLAQGQRLFATNSGGFLVAISRCVPLLPEIIACMAGLTKMPAVRFFTALACGSVPMGFLFAWIGAVGHDEPGLAVGLSVVLPAAFYGLALNLMKRPREAQPSSPAGRPHL